jgi:hypothetical protein
MVAPSSVLGLLSEKAPPWKGIKDFVKRRYNSIARGRKFVQLNKVGWEDVLLSLLWSASTDARKFALPLFLTVAPILWAPISTDAIRLL